MRGYISVDFTVCGGKPRIAGTRISVEIIQDHALMGYGVEQIQHIYPHLSTEQIRAAIEYPESAIADGRDADLLK